MSENHPKETKEEVIELNGLGYTLNKEEKTAKICYCTPKKERIIIPRSIVHESIEYLIIGILPRSFNQIPIKIVQFAEDSEVRILEKLSFSYSKIDTIILPSQLTTIDSEAFINSEIKSLTIPENVVELKKNWCLVVPNLDQVIVSPNNRRYKTFNKKMIIGKSNIDEENYNVLVFCSRDVSTVTIPNFIEIIASSSFRDCKKLKSIEFPSDSKLRIIEEEAFSNTSIEEITIPQHVSFIGKCAFDSCNKLETLKFSQNCEIKTLDECVISNTWIESLSIPASLTELKKSWCCDTGYLSHIEIDQNNPRYKLYDNKIIIGKSDIKQDNYDVLVFCSRDAKKVTIPSFIEIIETSSFSNCDNLESVEIPSDSKLRKIEEYAFNNSSIKRISIPSSVVFIGEGAFEDCYKLEQIDIPFESELKSIEKGTFQRTSIKYFFIPQHVTQICESAFENCEELQQIEFSPNSELKTIKKDAFSKTKIESLTIPANLVELESQCFANARALKNITISPNNPRYSLYDNKMIVGKTNIEQENYDILVFVLNGIEKITIPNFIEEIGFRIFSGVKDLKEIDFETGSKIQKFNDFLFGNSSIESVTLPESITEICENCFDAAFNIKRVEIPRNSQLRKICSFSFGISLIESILIPSKVIEICNYAFSHCKTLRYVEILDDSELQIIGSGAFNNTKIVSLKIPAGVIELQKSWCKKVPHLINVVVNPNNPRYKSYNDKMIIGKSSINDENYNILVFISRDALKVTIPNFIEIIASSSFENCDKIQSIEIPSDSKLQVIEDDAFCESSIEKIWLPNHLKKIGKNAFNNCKNLKKINFTSKSELNSIETNAFTNTSISCFSFPRNVTQIDDSFSLCQKLQIIEISENSEMKIVDIRFIKYSGHVILMVKSGLKINIDC